MEYEESPPKLETRAAAKKLNNVNSESKPQIGNLLMLKNVSEHQEDIICKVVEKDVNKENELQVEILQPEYATELNLEEKMNQLLEILDETINILEVVDFGSTDSLAFLNNDEDDDSCYDFIVCDQKSLNKDLSITECLDRTIVNEYQVETNNVNVTVTMDKKEKCNELNDYTESFIIGLVLVTLYFLLSSLM